jgi:hypothetical protein
VRANIRAIVLALIPWALTGVIVASGVLLTIRLHMAPPPPPAASGRASPAGAATESIRFAKCPLDIAPDIASSLGVDRDTGSGVTFRIYEYQTTSPHPHVTVSLSRNIDGEIGKAAVCELQYSNGREAPGPSVDWRIGAVMAVTRQRHGKPVRVTYRLKADRPIVANTAEVYVYDGARVERVLVGFLRPEWSTYVIRTRISPTATNLEIWFRLILGSGTVKPPEGSVYLAISMSSSD